MNSQRSALAIITALQKRGHLAYLAGGCVRDKLLGLEPQDFDIATDASVEEIVDLFEKTVTVGARFGVVLVLLDGHSVEVATFRQDGPYTDGRKPDGITRATPEEDAKRRDFTINGLFFDPANDQIIDYVAGQDDLKKRLLRAIGDPHKRFVEDRLRMLRAIRFACRFNLKIEEETFQAIQESAHLLFPSVSVERAWQELDKMKEFAPLAFARLHELSLLKALFKGRPYKVEAIASFTNMPKEAPLSFYLAKLFLKEPFSFWLDLAHFFKTSKAIVKEFELFDRARKLSDESPPYEWALYLAEDEKLLALKSLDRLAVTAKKMKRLLTEEIKRVKNKKPLITAATLQQEGIPSGPHLGELLKEAEILAINEQIRSPEELLRRLKTLSLWGLHKKDLQR